MGRVVLGVMYKQVDGASIDVGGFHVDSLMPIIGADDFLVLPNSPSSEHLGVPSSEVFRYKFDSAAHYAEFAEIE